MASPHRWTPPRDDHQTERAVVRACPPSPRSGETSGETSGGTSGETPGRIHGRRGPAVVSREFSFSGVFVFIIISPRHPSPRREMPDGTRERLSQRGVTRSGQMDENAKYSSQPDRTSPRTGSPHRTIAHRTVDTSGRWAPGPSRHPGSRGRSARRRERTRTRSCGRRGEEPPDDRVRDLGASGPRDPGTRTLRTQPRGLGTHGDHGFLAILVTAVASNRTRVLGTLPALGSAVRVRCGDDTPTGLVGTVHGGSSGCGGVHLPASPTRTRYLSNPDSVSRANRRWSP